MAMGSEPLTENKAVKNAREDAIKLLDEYFLACQELYKTDGQDKDKSARVWWRLGRLVHFAAQATTTYGDFFDINVEWKVGGNDSVS